MVTAAAYAYLGSSDLAAGALTLQTSGGPAAHPAASGLGAPRVRDALTQLGTAGRVGYDVAEAGYFHRTPPHAASAVARMNPRLAAARSLATAGAVIIDGPVAVVRSGDETYHVRDATSCTCRWWAKLRPTHPVPLLLATPTHVNGSLDAATLVDRLRRFEAEGREPWPLDFEQALLRLPRDTGPDVADGLTSAGGLRLAAWLAAGGMPDPIATRYEQRVTRSAWTHRDSPPAAGRTVVNLEPSRPASLTIENQLLTLARTPAMTYDPTGHLLDPAVLAATLPHHRDVSAAWAPPGLAALADQDQTGDASLLPLLADCTDPIGPAMSLALAYVLAARHEPHRVAATDAFLTLAAAETPAATKDQFAVATPVAAQTPLAAEAPVGAQASFAAGVGRDLGALAARDAIKLSRAAQSLTDAHRAGASAAVWELLAAALPPLLPAAPRGLPDLLELAARVAAAAGASAELPALSTVAARKGGSRLIKEARRLQSVLRANVR